MNNQLPTFQDDSYFTSRQKDRNPLIAGGLSLFFPGAGQLYNSQWTKGLAIFIPWVVICIVCLVVLVLGVVDLESFFIQTVEVIFSIVSLVAALDAYNDARRLNLYKP